MLNSTINRSRHAMSVMTISGDERNFSAAAARVVGTKIVAARSLLREKKKPHEGAMIVWTGNDRSAYSAEDTPTAEAGSVEGKPNDRREDSPLRL